MFVASNASSMRASFGGDGVAEFAEHVPKQHADLVFDDKDPLGLRRGLRFGRHPSALHWNRHATRSDRSNDALRLPWGDRQIKRQFAGTNRIGPGR